jgi:dCTP deaminase
MIADGRISAATPILPEQIQPASLDLRLGATAYRVRASFLAGEGRSVADRLDEFRMHRDRPERRRGAGKGLRLRGAADGGLDLPVDVQAVANAKARPGGSTC